MDWILARCRSGVNVMSDMLVAILLDRMTPAEEADTGAPASIPTEPAAAALGVAI